MRKENMSTKATKSEHKVVSREEWIAARKSHAHFSLKAVAQGHFFGFAFFTADFLAPFFAQLFPLPMSALAAW